MSAADFDSSLRRVRRHVVDLAVSFTDGEAHGPGLVVQLRSSLGVQQRDVGSEGGGGRKPSSRPPGWRADISELLGVIDTSVAGWMVGWQNRRPRSTVAALRLIPDLLPEDAVEDVEGTLGHFSVRAQVALGYRIPSVEMPGCSCRKRVLTMSGWRQVGCGATMLRAPARIDTATRNAAVWCSNPHCHDSLAFPECEQGADGNWSCRRSDRDYKHSIRWTSDEWGGLYAQQQGVGA